MAHTRRKLVLAGGSGFLGTIVAEWFVERGWDVVILTRRPRDRCEAIREAAWDGRTQGAWCAELEGADAVVNLAGRSVDCRYGPRNRRAIMDSRIESTRVLGEAIANCRQPPRVWLNSSTATIYKHSHDRPMDEARGEIEATQEAHDAFSIEVATAWEKTFAAAPTPATRKLALRIAMVLSPRAGTVFRILRRLARCGVGGAMGDGRQFMSWIHEIDFCRAVEWLIGRDDVSGAVNVAAPNPLPNREVMRLIRRRCGLPFGLPIPRPLLEIGAFVLRTETELVLKSRRVVPGRLTEQGFAFEFPNLKDAVDELERRLRGNPRSTGVGNDSRNQRQACSA